MTDYKIWLGYLATAIAMASYIPYFWGIYTGKTKPHAFTWFVWSVINAIAFTAILISGGGTGSFILAVNTISCLIISLVAFRKGTIAYDLYDWLALFGGILGAVLWAFTKNPLTAIILVFISDAIGFIPTFRKAYRLPFEDSATSFALGVIYYLVAIFAFEKLTLTTLLYPIEIIILDATFVILLLIRRKKITQK